MIHRLFIGFKISRKIIPTINILKSTIGKNSRCYNWVSGNNLHLTLLFLGSQKNEFLDEINTRIITVLKEVKSFNFQVEGTGSFSNNNTLWIGINNHYQFNQMNYELKVILDNYLNLKKKAKYFPHITIARKKKEYNNKIDVKNFLNSVYFPIEFRVDYITLFESKIIDNKIHYKKIKKINLI